MDVLVDTTNGRSDVRAADDLQRLCVRTDPAASPAAVAHALGSLGQLDGTDHAWLDIEALRSAAGRDGDSSWLAGFDKMIAYATSRGWVNDSGTAVRAHIEHETTGA